MHQLLRLGRSGAILGVLVAGVRCSGSDIVLPSEARPATITKFDGDEQTGRVGAPLPRPVIVKVVDQRGTAVAGQDVSFAPGEGSDGIQVTPEVATTDDEGLAQAEWVLGPATGPQSIVAGLVGEDGLTVTFQATAQPGDPRRMQESGGNNQEARVGTSLTDPLVVLVTDELGNPVEGATVEWSAESGSVDPMSSTTGPDGKTSTTWTLGASIGTQRAAAEMQGLDGSPVSFTATSRAGGAARLVLVSGNNQSGSPGQELARPLVVRLEDEAGNGVPNRAVSWVVGSGGGSVSATTSSTDGNGEAQVRWTLGSSSGQNTVNAVVSGVGFITFSATAGGGGGDGEGEGGGDGGGGGGGGGEGPGATSTRLQFLVHPSDTERNEEIEPEIRVGVLDQNGLVTQGEFEITLELLGDNDGKIKGHEHETTRSGVATFEEIKIDREGEYRLRATAAGVPSVESQAFQIHDREGHGGD
jgi:hypothetical protein